MFNKVTFKLNTQALVNGIDMVVVLLSTYTGPAVFVKMSAVNSAEICQLTSPHSPAPLPCYLTIIARVTIIRYVIILLFSRCNVSISSCMIKH